MITIQNDNGFIPYDTLVFSGGEVHVRLKDMPVRSRSVRVTARLYSSEDIMKLLMVTDALKRYGYRDIDLVCPYFPYARQDRVCNPGEALGAKVMADLINAQGYRSVEIWDVHSDVSQALINNCTVIHQFAFVRHIALENTSLVSPDAGAMKKTYFCGEHAGRDVVVASKHRDTKTGNITGVSFNPDNNYRNNQDYLIVDDICDGGRTFIELAKEIRKYTDGKVSLYITHGIFSRGFDELRKVIDHVYCANIWPDRFKGNDDYVTVLNRS